MKYMVYMVCSGEKVGCHACGRKTQGQRTECDLAIDLDLAQEG